MKLIVGIIALWALSAAAQTPAGWQVAKDRKQLCQLSVPAGWTADKIMPSSLTAADKKGSVVFSHKPASVSYADLVKMAKEMFKPVKIFEESGSRTWFAAQPGPGQTGTSWYVAMNSSPVCEAQITFKNAAFEESAKQMVNSLKPVK